MGGSAADGELDGESHAAAVRGSTALEAGREAGGRKPAVHLVDTETDGIAGFRRGRRLQEADRDRAAADQADIGMISGLIRLRAADGDDDVATVGKLAVVPAQSGHLAAEQRPVKEQTRSGSSRGRCSARRAVLHQGRGTGCCDKLPQRVPPAASSAGRDWASTTPGQPEPSAPSIAGGTTSSGG